VRKYMTKTFTQAYKRLPAHQLELQELALLGYGAHMNVAVVTFTGRRYTMWPISYQTSGNSWFLFFLRRPGIHWELLVEKRSAEQIRVVFSHAEVRLWLRHFGHELDVDIHPVEHMEPLLYDTVSHEFIPIGAYHWKEDEAEEEEEEEEEEELSALAQAWCTLRVSEHNS
jgi:hypothetical protein